MTRWTRAETDGLCGRCHMAYGPGGPIFEIIGPTWTKRRGTCCAGDAPPDLAPALPGRSTAPMVSAARGIERMARVNGWIK